MNGNTDPTGNASSDQESTPIKSFSGGMIILSVYLFLILAISVYFLAGLMLADTTSSGTSGQTLAACKNLANTNTNANCAGPCNTNTSNSNISNTNSSNTVNANAANTAVNTKANGNTANTASANSNSANANPASNSTAKGNAAGTNKANTDSSNSSNSSSNSSQSDQNHTVPNVIRLNAPGYLIDFGCITGDGYLFLVVLFAGMMGAAIRGLYSFILHLGRRDFGFNWIWYYILLPYFGGSLSLVLYFVIRGGFYSNSVGKALDLNVFSFAALAALTGLFSDQALAKLKLVAESLLTKTEPKTDQPAIAALTVSPSNITLDGTTPSQQLKVTALDVQNRPISGISPDALRWIPENPSIATVDPKGMVTKVAVGVTSVKVTTADNKITSNKCSVTCNA